MDFFDDFRSGNVHATAALSIFSEDTRDSVLVTLDQIKPSGVVSGRIVQMLNAIKNSGKRTLASHVGPRTRYLWQFTNKDETNKSGTARSFFLSPLLFRSLVPLCFGEHGQPGLPADNRVRGERDGGA